MKRFFDLTFRPFFVLTGIGTALAAFDAFWPRWTIENVQKLAFIQDYTILVQHWGIMAGLMGVNDRGRFSGGLANSDSHL